LALSHDHMTLMTDLSCMMLTVINIYYNNYDSGCRFFTAQDGFGMGKWKAVSVCGGLGYKHVGGTHVSYVVFN